MPMDGTTRERVRHFRDIKDEISNLSPHVILILIPGEIAWIIRVGIKHSNTSELRSSFDRWRIVQITDDHGIVTHDDWSVDKIGSRRNVDERGLDSGRFAWIRLRVLSMTSVEGEIHGVLQALSVICNAIA